MDNTYTVRIARSNPDEALVTAIIELTGDKVRITAVHAETGPSDPVPAQLASIDFSLLVRTAQILSGAPESPSASGSASREDDEPPAASERPPQPASRVTEVEEQPVFDNPTPESRKSSEREMPGDFGVNYWRLSSISKVAKHYGVPHHVAQHWIKSLQQQGKAADPWPKRRMRPSR